MPRSRYGRYRNSEDARLMSLSEVCDEIGRTPKQTKKLLRKMGWMGTLPIETDANKVLYPTEAVEALKQMLGQPNNYQAPTWFDDYLKGRS